MTKPKSYCDGAGHPGGPKYYRDCETCGRRLPTTAFKGEGLSCRKCCGVYVGGMRHKGRKTGTGIFTPDVGDLHASRCSFKIWMLRCRATADDLRIVRASLARYAQKEPSADDVLEAARNVPGMTYGQRFHAVVLAANEAKKRGTRELRKYQSRERETEANVA